MSKKATLLVATSVVEPKPLVVAADFSAGDCSKAARVAGAIATVTVVADCLPSVRLRRLIAAVILVLLHAASQSLAVLLFLAASLLLAAHQSLAVAVAVKSLAAADAVVAADAQRVVADARPVVADAELSLVVQTAARPWIAVLSLPSQLKLHQPRLLTQPLIRVLTLRRPKMLYSI